MVYKIIYHAYIQARQLKAEIKMHYTSTRYVYGNSPSRVKLSEYHGDESTEMLISVAGESVDDEEVHVCVLDEELYGHAAGSIVVTGLTCEGHDFCVLVQIIEASVDMISKWEKLLALIDEDARIGEFEETFLIEGEHYRNGAWTQSGSWFLCWNTDKEFHSQTMIAREIHDTNKL